MSEIGYRPNRILFETFVTREVKHMSPTFKKLTLRTGKRCGHMCRTSWEEQSSTGEELEKWIIWKTSPSKSQDGSMQAMVWGSCLLQSLHVRLTTEGPSGAAVSRVNCVAVVSYFPRTEHIQPLNLKDQESPFFPFLSKLISLFLHVLNSLCG